MIYDNKNAYMIRLYLKLSTSEVSLLTHTPLETILEIERGNLAISNNLIKFYSKHLNVKYHYLYPILKSNEKFKGRATISYIINKYFGVILKLREYEKNNKV